MKKTKHHLTHAMVGESVHLYCCRYIYRGTVVAVDASTVLLRGASIVYETGPLQGPPQDSQELPSDHRVRLDAVESWGLAPDA